MAFDTRRLTTTLSAFHNSVRRVPSVCSTLGCRNGGLCRCTHRNVRIPHRTHPVAICRLLFVHRRNGRLRLRVRYSGNACVHAVVSSLNRGLNYNTRIVCLHHLTMDGCPIRQVIALRRLHRLIRRTRRRSVPTTRLLSPLLVPVSDPTSSCPIIGLPLASSICFGGNGPIHASNTPLRKLIHIARNRGNGFVNVNRVSSRNHITPHHLIIRCPTWYWPSYSGESLQMRCYHLASHGLFGALHGMR